ncbi:hypothetical protein HDV00_006015 [Rhizophlyctis rosea]|nr:hypothetical protein HDV00_006015 [Rhizophlyctis rosea]
MAMVDRFVGINFQAEIQEAAATYLKSLADVQQITVENFLGIKGEKTIRLHALPPGAYMVQSPNGARKSQLIDAIAWCLFGKTLRGAGQIEILNNFETDKKRCAVSVLVKDGTLIRRTLQPSLSATLPDGSKVEMGKGVTETQERLEREIPNSDWDTFQRTVLLDSSDFLDLFTKKDAHRSTVLESLLGMGVLDQMYRAVEVGYKDVVTQQRELSEEEAQLESRLQAVNRRLEELRAERENITVQIDVKLDELGKDASKAAVLAFALSQETEQYTADLETLGCDRDALHTQLLTATEARTRISSLVSSRRAQEEALQFEHKTKEKQLESCTVDIAHQQKEVDRLQAESDNLVKQTTTLESELLVEGRVGEWEQAYDDASIALLAAVDAVREHQEVTVNESERLKDAENQEVHRLTTRKNMLEGRGEEELQRREMFNRQCKEEETRWRSA